MSRPPRPKAASILGKTGLLTILIFGLYTATATLWIFYTLLPQGEDIARTAAFTAMLLFEKSSVFAFRALTLPVSKIGWFSNRVLIAALTISVGLQVVAVYWSPLQTLLHTVPLAFEHWIMIAVFCVPLILVPELYKALTWKSKLARVSG